MNYTNPHAPGCFWFDQAESYGSPNIKWCEETLCQVVSEPANTWSNLGYLLVAFIIVGIANHRKDPIELKQFGIIVFFMGAMSFFYHQSNFYVSQIMDFVGMFLFVGWAIGMNAIRLGWFQKKKLVLFNLILCGVLVGVMHLMYLAGVKFQSLVLIAGFTIIGTEFKARKLIQVNYKFITTAALILISAFGFSIADGQRLWCTPTNHGWFEQGHAIWHWISSVAMLFIYLHYSQPALKEQLRKKSSP